MKYEPFDCCSAYNECSDLGRCIKEAEKRNACTYWIRHLSKGVAFYGKNPGLLEGHIFINIDGRAFRISKRKKNNSYIMDRAYRNVLRVEFNQIGIPYSTQAEGECIVAGCPENPAKYKVDFAVNEYEYTIKNYNGWALEVDAVQQIIGAIGTKVSLVSNPPIANRGHRQTIEDERYYGRMTVFTFIDNNLEQPEHIEQEPLMVPDKLTVKTEAPAQVKESKATKEYLKLPKGDELMQGKFVQCSLWDVIVTSSSWGSILQQSAK